MPQKSIRFKLDGYEKTIEVRELRVRQILALAQTESGETSLPTFQTFVEDQLLPIATKLTLDELMDMYPSDLQEILEKFKAVNSSFFVLAEASGLGEILSRLKDALLLDFSRLLVTSLKPGIPSV